MSADKLTLGDLKKLIKDHMKTAPKLSSGKQNLLLYADKMGLIKKKEAPSVTKTELPASLKKAKEVKSAPVVSELPANLKKAKAPKAEPVEESKSSKKAPSGFAKFMSENKGKGFSMSQMSQMYRDLKNE